MASNNTEKNTEVFFGPSVPFGHPAWHPPGWAHIDESAHTSVKTFSMPKTPLRGFHPDSILGRYHSSSYPGERPLDLLAVNEALTKFQEMSVGNSNMFPAFLDNSPSSSNLAGLPRQAPSPMAQHQGNPQVNGAGMNGMNGMNVGLPMNAGQQMDLTVLYAQVEELSNLLKENREKTQAIIASAEDLAVSCASIILVRCWTFAALSFYSKPYVETSTDINLSDSRCDLRNTPHFGASQQRDYEYGIFFPLFEVYIHAILRILLNFPRQPTAARVADLQRQLSAAHNTIDKLTHARREDVKLLKEYESGISHITELVRNYATSREQELHRVEKHYNGLLQVERDAHVAERLEGLQWQEKYNELVGKMRQAYRLRCDEAATPTRVVAGLQNEVRAYRNALNMEPESFEEEFGWEVLKDVPGAAE